MKKELLIEEVKYVSVTQIIPESWESWFYSELSSSSDITWGDSNLTLIGADRIIKELNEMDDCFFDFHAENQKKVLIETLEYLSSNNIYVDLES